MPKYFALKIKENKGALFLVLMMVFFRSAIADWNDVPTGSMKPTIMEGDRIWIDKTAYDFRLPFTHISLLHFANPQRGDIVVFDSKAADKRLVKRVIGIPGDTVFMQNNRIILNGKVLSYRLQQVSTDYLTLVETLPGKEHKIQLRKNVYVPQSDFAPVKIPDGYYLVLGDNRDNSADSRFIGLVPRDEIIGKTDKVILSLDYNHYFLPRLDRFFSSI